MSAPTEPTPERESLLIELAEVVDGVRLIARRARKPHQCFVAHKFGRLHDQYPAADIAAEFPQWVPACGGVIEPGETYVEYKDGEDTYRSGTAYCVADAIRHFGADR